MKKSAVCLDGAPSLLSRRETQPCKSGSPNLFPDKILVRTKHDFWFKDHFFFFMNLSHDQVRTQPREDTVGMHFKYKEDGLWTELQVCSAQVTSVHGCLSSVSAVPLHCVHRLLTSMISTSALLPLTIGTSILLKVSFLDSLSSVAFAIDPVKEMRSKMSERTRTASVFQTFYFCNFKN